MDRNSLMEAIATRAGESRIGLAQVWAEAGISATSLHRWRKGKCIPKMPTIGKLETALERLTAQ